MTDLRERVARAIYDAVWGQNAHLVLHTSEAEYAEAAAQADAAISLCRDHYAMVAEERRNAYRKREADEGFKHKATYYMAVGADDVLAAIRGDKT